MKKNFIILSLLLLWALSACGPALVRAGELTRTPVPSDESMHPSVPSEDPTLEPLPTGEPTTTPEVFNPLPQDQRAFEAVRALLAKQLNVDPLSIKLVEVKPMDWSDSCLGLGGPAESCLQAITPGFLVKVQAGANAYEFHTDQSGESIRQVP